MAEARMSPRAALRRSEHCRRQVGAIGIAMIALGLLAGACSSGPDGSSVAHLGSTTSTTPGGSAGSSGGSSLAQATDFASCMRQHGLSNFPDPTPTPNGGFSYQFPTGLSPNSPQFQAAESSCKALEPTSLTGGEPSPAIQQAFLEWAACIRSHGVPNFPDPTFSAHGVNLIYPHSNTNPQLPSAQAACRSKLPAGYSGGS